MHNWQKLVLARFGSILQTMDFITLTTRYIAIHASSKDSDLRKKFVDIFFLNCNDANNKSFNYCSSSIATHVSASIVHWCKNNFARCLTMYKSIFCIFCCNLYNVSQNKSSPSSKKKILHKYTNFIGCLLSFKRNL